MAAVYNTAVDAIDRLQAQIGIEERRLADSCGGRDWPVIVMELARAQDYCFFTTFLNHPRADIQADALLTSLYARGWMKVLSLFYAGGWDKDGVPLLPSNDKTMLWSNSVIQYAGNVAYAEGLVVAYERELVDLTLASPDEIAVTPATKYYGLEALEDEELHWLRESVDQFLRPVHDEIARENQAVWNAMRDRVYCWRDHYVGYDTTPDIDAHYDSVGAFLAQRMYEKDDFHGSAVFGGKPFSFYEAAVAWLIGLAYKHIDFSSLLLQRRRDLVLGNLLTIPRDFDLLAQSLANVLNVDQGNARQVLEMLTLTPENRDRHCAEGRAGPPPLIRVGRSHVIHSLTGSLAAPFCFLLRELKFHYRKDWDRALAGRENRFRAELNCLFPGDRFHKCQQSIKLRDISGCITDIDGAVYDRTSGTLGLFQLKWQDPFDSSMRERASRKRNLTEEVTRWIERVSRWVEECGTPKLAQTLGIRRSGITAAPKIRLFVMCQHSAHFSGDAQPDQRVAWGIWPQVVRLRLEEGRTADPLDQLFQALKAQSPFTREPPEFDMDDMQIGSLKITHRLDGLE